MKKEFQELVNAVIPLLPITKKAEVPDYVQCLMNFYEYIATSKATHMGRRYKRATCAARIHDNPAIGLRFLAELQRLGFLKIAVGRGNGKRLINFLEPTEFLVELLKKHEPHQNTIRYPTRDKLQNHFEVRRKGVVIDVLNAKLGGCIANTQFTINEFTLGLLIKYPVYTERDPEFISYYRCLEESRKALNNIFRFPYFYCSRGRAYVDSTVGYSPQGADHEKALVLPDYKEVLTASGVEALKEAMLGYSEQEWCDSTILSFARYPDRYRDEWMKADKPFSFMALAKLYLAYTIDPEQSLPAFIPLDGRCSGLQHWSAILRSSAITSRLGMEENESSDGLDIYEYVAYKWTAELEEKYRHLISRKVCKKPVMTFAYSATRMSAMDNVAELLGQVTEFQEGEWKVVKEGLTRVESANLGSHLFNLTNDILQPMVKGVDWLKVCVKTIMLKTNDPEITFPTYDGFLGKQITFKENDMKVQVVDSQGKRHSVTLLVPQLDLYGQKIPSIEKAQSGIGPNIIHSLDATHLRMVAKALEELGIVGIWIHDSFAVHVNYRAVLYKLIIEKFIELYDRNFMLIYKQWWENTYDVLLPDPPDLGDWQLEILHKCVRFFE